MFKKKEEDLYLFYHNRVKWADQGWWIATETPGPYTPPENSQRRETTAGVKSYRAHSPDNDSMPNKCSVWGTAGAYNPKIGFTGKWEPEQATLLTNAPYYTMAEQGWVGPYMMIVAAEDGGGGMLIDGAGERAKALLGAGIEGVTQEGVERIATIDGYYEVVEDHPHKHSPTSETFPLGHPDGPRPVWRRARALTEDELAKVAQKVEKRENTCCVIL